MDVVDIVSYLFGGVVDGGGERFTSIGFLWGFCRSRAQEVIGLSLDRMLGGPRNIAQGFLKKSVEFDIMLTIGYLEEREMWILNYT